MYDLIIKNGLIVDGSGASAFLGDIAVKGDRIALIAEKIDDNATEVYDANGKYIIPGLIDPHVHEEWVCLVDGRYELFLKQGVTTTINGNCGHSVTPGPVSNITEYYLGNGLMNHRQQADYNKRFPAWDDFSGYKKAVESIGTNLNLATLLGHGTIRWTVMNGAHPRKPNEAESKEIETHIRKGMEQGMFGISFGLDYVPSRYADIDELCEIVSLVKEYDGVSAAHLRHYIGILESTKEYIEVGRRTKARLQFSHLASSVPEAHTAIKEAIENEGLDARIDTIPDSVGHCVSKNRLQLFIMAISDSLFDQGIEGVKRALRDPQGREDIKKDAYIFAGEKSSKYIVNSSDPSLENRSIADIAAERGVDPDDCILDLIGDDNDYTFWLNAPAGNVPSKFVEHNEEITSNPYVSVGSDEIMGDIEDPFDWYEIRRRGSFAIFTNMYLKKGIKYEEIVRRNTSMIAEHFDIKSRGRLKEGYFADIAVIDLENYKFPEVSQEHYKTPTLTASGCNLTVVNGKIALKDGEVRKTFSGKVLIKGQE